MSPNCSRKYESCEIFAPTSSVMRNIKALPLVLSRVMIILFLNATNYFDNFNQVLYKCAQLTKTYALLEVYDWDMIWTVKYLKCFPAQKIQISFPDSGAKENVDFISHLNSWVHYDCNISPKPSQVWSEFLDKSRNVSVKILLLRNTERL